MHQASVHHFHAAIDAGVSDAIPQPPPSGVRLRDLPQPGVLLRNLALKAESLGLELLAFELFFVAAQLDATGRTDVARRDLEVALLEASEIEARFYRRAARALALGA